jgi:tRNA(Ile)-lysidine synthase
VSNADGAPVSAAEARALFADLRRAPSLVLAVSGGPDSTALLLLAARWRSALRQGPTLLAVTVDHGLRRESAAEAAVVKTLAERLGVAHRTVRWTAPKPKTGVQAAARDARYRLLASAAKRVGARHVVTAHTLDDQAETVLFRLARGSGLTGLAAMARTTSLDGIVLVRPFLDVPKARLIATLRATRTPFIEDPSNLDPRFTRPRLRALMPSLAAEGLDASRLAQLARRMGRADAALAAVTREALSPIATPPNGVSVDARAFERLPAEIALRFLQCTISSLGDEGPPELRKLEALLEVLAAARPGTAGHVRRTLAGALVTLTRDSLTIERAPPRRIRPAAARGKLSARKRGLFTKSR